MTRKELGIEWLQLCTQHLPAMPVFADLLFDPDSIEEDIPENFQCAKWINGKTWKDLSIQDVIINRSLIYHLDWKEILALFPALLSTCFDENNDACVYLFDCLSLDRLSNIGVEEGKVYFGQFTDRMKEIVWLSIEQALGYDENIIAKGAKFFGAMWGDDKAMRRILVRTNILSIWHSFEEINLSPYSTSDGDIEYQECLEVLFQGTWMDISASTMLEHRSCFSMLRIEQKLLILPALLRAFLELTLEDEESANELVFYVGGVASDALRLNVMRFFDESQVKVILQVFQFMLDWPHICEENKKWLGEIRAGWTNWLADRREET